MKKARKLTLVEQLELSLGIIVETTDRMATESNVKVFSYAPC